MAEVKTIELRVDATEAEKALSKFGGTLEQVNGEGAQPLNFAIGELEDRLYELAAQGKQNTKEFQDMASEVGRMKKVIIETDMVLDGLSQNLAQSTAGAVGGLAAGFELAQGTMAAFGVQGAKVEEALLKVQSAMAISQGIQGIKESIASFQALGQMIRKTAVVQKLLTSSTWLGTAAQWALNVAMNANPIGALILGITALVGAITYFASAANDAAEVNDRLNATLEEQNKILDATEARIRKNSQQKMELLQATGASEKELHEERLRQLKEEEELRKIGIKREKFFIEDKRKAYKRALDQGFTDLAAEIADEIKESRGRYDELVAQNGDYHHKLKVENENFRREEEEKRKADYEKRLSDFKAYQANRIQAQREIQDLELNLQYENEQKAQDANRLAYERRIEDVRRDETKTAEEKAKIVSLLEQEAFMKRKEIAQQFADETRLETLEFKKTELAELETLELDAKIALNEKKKEIDEQDKQNAKDAMDARISLASSAFQTLGELANAFAGESEESQKRAFKINKAAGIAQATIETYQAASGAYASQMTIPSPDAPVRATIAAAIAVASGIARIKAIAKTKFQGGGGGSISSGGGSSAPSIGGGSQPAQFNVVGNNGVNQLAQTLGNEPLKAYVVTGEITSAQSLERNKIETATL